MDSWKKVGIGIGVMLLNNGRVLLGKRNDDPNKADSLLHGEGTWTLPGGKLHFGESFEEAACREVLEETGIMIDKKTLRVISITNDMVSDAHFVTIGLFAETDDEPRVMEPDEIVEWRWFSFSALPNPIFPPSEKMIKNYLNGAIYRH